MAFHSLCPPALIYLIFSLTQVVIDAVSGLYNTALVKVWVSFVFTILLNYLCDLGLGIVSWIIVFIPFILMTVIVAILLLMFGLDPITGKLKISDLDKSKKEDIKPKNTNLGIDLREKSKKEKEILAKSLLSYSDEEQQVSMTTNYHSTARLDINMFKLMIYELSNVLSNIGEQEIAIYFKTNSLSCARENKDLSSNKEALLVCYKKIYEKIDELPEDRKTRVKNTINTFIANIENK